MAGGYFLAGRTSQNPVKRKPNFGELRECELRRNPQRVEKLPWVALSHQIGHQICRFGTFSSPICGRYQLNADFFNTLPDPYSIIWRTEQRLAGRWA
jgi:hypothetical protein